jgi:predicted nucleotidyltransferase
MHYLLTQKKSEVAALCRSTGVRRLDVFGSAVRDDFDAVGSDLDFLVEFEDAAPVAYAQAFFRLRSGLEALFGRPVDLLTPRNLANPFLRDRIAAEREALYACG